MAAAPASRPGCEVVLIGGTLDLRAMVATGARTIEGYRGIAADVLFLGVWALHAEHGISGGHFEESEVRRALLGCADRVVGLASREKLGTVAPFPVGPATALTHLATDAPSDTLGPFTDLGIAVLRA